MYLLKIYLIFKKNTKNLLIIILITKLKNININDLQNLHAHPLIITNHLNYQLNT